ncbi:hypothetical protein Tco_1099816 [Tanacetum coccineum]
MGFGLKLNYSGNIISRIFDILDITNSKSESKKSLGSIAIISWNIWKSRNRFIFEHTEPCPTQVISTINVMIHEADKSVSHDSDSNPSARNDHSSQDSSPKWVPPTLNIVKLNCDRAFELNQGSVEPVCDPPWSIAAIVGDIKAWGLRLNLHFSWMTRTRNRVAHQVANLALNSVANFFWDADFLVEITSLARSTEMV